MRHLPIVMLALVGLVAGQACDQNDEKEKLDQVKDVSLADKAPGDTGGTPEADCGAAAAQSDGVCLVADTLAPGDAASLDALIPDTNAADVPVLDTTPADLGQADLGTDDVGPGDLGADVVPDFPLEVGDKVPDFSLKAHDGTTFTLSAYAGKNVVISAFPAAKTAVCEWQTCWVNDHYQEFLDLNTIPVGLSTDNLGKLALWAQEQSYKQLLLSDTNPIGEVSKMFGIFTESLFVTTRSLLVIDANGVLVYKKIFAMGANPDFEALMAFLKTLPQ